MAVAAATFSESTPAASGMRARSAHAGRRSADSPARSLPTTIADRAGGDRRQVDGVVGRRQGDRGDAGSTDRAHEASTSSTRAHGSENAVPMATRSERRASGSALPASSTTPSQPSPAALRTIAPTFDGLSTPCTTTRRSRAAERVGIGGCWTLEHGQHRLHDPESRRGPAHVLPGGVHRDGQRGGDRRHAVGVDERARPAGTRPPAPARRRGRPRRGTSLARRHPCRRSCRSLMANGRRRASPGSSTRTIAITGSSEVVRDAGPVRRPLLEERRRGPRRPRRSRTPAGSPRRRTAAGRRARRR